MPISVVIITHNEEENLPRTLSKLTWCDDIIIVDSFSTDNTEHIAKKSNVKFIRNVFEGYGQQKNFGASKAKHDWVLSIDADEVLSDALIEELNSMDLLNSNVSGFQIPIRHVFMNKEFQYGKESKYLHLRLYNKTKGSYNSNQIHEKIEVHGNVGRLKNVIIHYSYQDLNHYFQKMNIYSTRGAEKLFKEAKSRSILAIFTYAPFYFIKHYFLYRNFLNGLPGLVWSYLNAWYHTTKYLKLYELNSAKAMNSV